jgi:hypothetical protein
MSCTQALRCGQTLFFLDYSSLLINECRWVAKRTTTTRVRRYRWSESARLTARVDSIGDGLLPYSLLPWKFELLCGGPRIRKGGKENVDIWLANFLDNVYFWAISLVGIFITTITRRNFMSRERLISNEWDGVTTTQRMQIQCWYQLSKQTYIHPSQQSRHKPPVCPQTHSELASLTFNLVSVGIDR